MTSIGWTKEHSGVRLIHQSGRICEANGFEGKVLIVTCSSNLSGRAITSGLADQGAQPPACDPANDGSSTGAQRFPRRWLTSPRDSALPALFVSTNEASNVIGATPGLDSGSNAVRFDLGAHGAEAGRDAHG
jgi:hypothetical protein